MTLKHRFIRIFTLALAGAVAAGVCSCSPKVSAPKGFVETPNSSQTAPEGVADLSRLEGMEHPRLLMSGEDFAELKNKVEKHPAQNEALCRLHALLMETADSSLAEKGEISFKLDASGKRLLTQSRNALRRIGSCAYAYRMSGEQKYLDKAVSDMESVLAFPSWNPKHFLDVGEMAFAVALGYDWLYYSLPYELRAKAEDELLQRAVIPFRTHSARLSVSNWSQVCYGGALSGAIAIYGKERENCGALINECIADNTTVVKAIYDPDGVYPEGYSYWGYGTGYEAVILTELQRVFGKLYGIDSSTGLERTAEWMLMSSGVGARPYSFGDSVSKFDQPKAGMWWFAAHYGKPSLLGNELKLLYNASGKEANPYSTKMSEVRFLPMVIANANRIKDLDSAVKENAPRQNFFYGKGETPVVMVRGDWTNSDSDRYLAFKGGQADRSHGHMDAGSFVFDALGCRWSTEVNRPGYATIEKALKEVGGKYWSMAQNSYRWKVFRLNNRAHSTLTINDSDHYAKGFASIDSVFNTAASKGAVMNLSPLFEGEAQSVERTYELREGGDLYVTDKVTAREDRDAVVEWRMMTPAKVTVGSTGETLTQEGKTMYLKVKVPEGSAEPSFKTWEAKGKNSWDTECTGNTVAGFTITVPKGQTLTFQTILTEVR